MSEEPRAIALDYQPCRYGASKLRFRGPGRALDAPFIACLGGSETYGKFIAAPWPALAEEATGRRLVNFGCMNAGIDSYLGDAPTLATIAWARGAIVQAMDAHTLSNRFYTVHPRRNDRFIRPAPALRDLYPEVDFTEFHFTRHMLSHLKAVSETRFETVREELHSAWLARMRALARALPERRVLMVLPRPPAEIAALPEEALGPGPLFVTPELVSEGGEDFSATLTVVPGSAALAAGTEGMVFADLDAAAAAEMPGPTLHSEAAAQLAPVIDRVFG